MTEPASRSELLDRLLCVLAGLLTFVLCTVVFVWATWRPPRRRPPISECRNNLKQLGIGMRLYLDGPGARTQWPAADGSDFLIQLYLTGIMRDAGSYLCPASGDTNDDGAALRLGAGSGATNATSYAGRRNARQASYPELFTTRGAAETSVASDDADGAKPFNHGDALNVDRAARRHLRRHDADVAVPAGQLTRLLHSSHGHARAR